MNMFGLDAGEVRQLVGDVRPAEPSPAEPSPTEPSASESNAPEPSAAETGEGFARAAWTGIAEPGDRVAGELISALGAGSALTALVEHWTVDRLESELRERCELTAAEIRAGVARWTPRLNSASTVTSLRQAARLGVRLLVPHDTAWVRGVDGLGAHAPIALWVRGTERALASIEHSISLVGARAATGYGEHVTMEAAAGLVDRGFAVVSGAAYGIDGMAHRSALASMGQTVAFLAGGVDRFYPSGHDALLSRMTESGAVISELPPGAQPSKWRFLQRNRLIAAASQATVVLEAGWRSGSLNTAAHAAALGRPLGAVPGPVTSPASAGCHRLIRDFDAVCVTNAEQMAELCAHSSPGEGSSASGGESKSDISPDTVRVLDALSRRSGRLLEDIAARAGLSLDTTRAQLGMLSLEARVAERERGWVRVS